MRRGTKLIVSLVLVGTLLAVTGTAWAQGPAGRETLRGQVVAIDGNVLLVSTASGEERRVILGEETRLLFPGVREPSIEDIEVGHYVGAWGEIGEDGDLLARVVVVVPAALAQRGYAVQGHVARIDGRVLTVETPRGERMVITGEETRFIIPRVEEPTIEDVQVGDPLLALGRPDEQGNLVARVVAVVTPGQVRRHTLRGVITALEGDTIGLLTGRGDVRVLTDDETVFRIPGVEDPGLDDLRVGDRVGVLIARAEGGDGGLLAKVALVRRADESLSGTLTAPVEAATALLESFAQQVGIN